MTLRATDIRGAQLFFPLALAFSVAWVPVWMLRYGGALPLSSHLPGAAWHGHEMIFGYLAAVLAGFLTVADRGWRILLLVTLWAAGRLLLLVEAPLPASVVALADIAFLPLLFALRRPRLWAGAKMMTLGIACVIGLLAALNAWSHWTAMSGGGSPAIEAAAMVTVLLMVIVAGRLVPGHTRAATRRGPGLALFRTEEQASIGIAALSVGASAARLDVATGLLTLALAGLQAVRLWRWRDRRVMRDPLLWGLHLGFGWLVPGLAVFGLSRLGLRLDPTDALHLVLVGSLGTLTLSIMMRLIRARATLPQTGGRPEALVLALVTAATVLRGVLPLVWPDGRLLASGLAAIMWSGAALLTLILYLPLTTRAPVARTGARRGR